MKAIGVDVGGSGCRLAVVNVHTGRIEGNVERLSHDVNTPAEPILDALSTALNRMPNLPVGLGFPGRVHGTTVRTAPNLDRLNKSYPITECRSEPHNDRLTLSIRWT